MCGSVTGPRLDRPPEIHLISKLTVLLGSIDGHRVLHKDMIDGESKVRKNFKNSILSVITSLSSYSMNEFRNTASSTEA